MTCLTDGALRARLDAQLAPAESLEMENHLASCAACRTHAERISREAERANQALAALAPVPGEAPVDPIVALARFKAGEKSREAASIPALSRFFPSRLRPAWAALAAV